MLHTERGEPRPPTCCLLRNRKRPRDQPRLLASTRPARNTPVRYCRAAPQRPGQYYPGSDPPIPLPIYSVDGKGAREQRRILGCRRNGVPIITCTHLFERPPLPVVVGARGFVRILRLHNGGRALRPRQAVRRRCAIATGSEPETGANTVVVPRCSAYLSGRHRPRVRPLPRHIPTSPAPAPASRPPPCGAAEQVRDGMMCV